MLFSCVNMRHYKNYYYQLLSTFLYRYTCRLIRRRIAMHILLAASYPSLPIPAVFSHFTVDQLIDNGSSDPKRETNENRSPGGDIRKWGSLYSAHRIRVAEPKKVGQTAQLPLGTCIALLPDSLLHFQVSSGYTWTSFLNTQKGKATRLVHTCTHTLHRDKRVNRLDYLCIFALCMDDLTTRGLNARIHRAFPRSMIAITL